MHAHGLAAGQKTVGNQDKAAGPSRAVGHRPVGCGPIFSKPKLTLCYVFFQVGTVDPVEDFRTLISQRDEDRFDEGMLSLSPTELVNHSVSHLISAKQQLVMCRLRFEIPKTNKILAK